jgi:purine-nucleoside/S-methyl-5'-thioadenosine phosphorylase / adenosine deaminase
MPSAKTKAKRSQERRSSHPQQALGDGWKTGRAAGLELLVAESLAAIPWLVHGFSTRRGGESYLADEGVLNLGFTDWNARDRVTQNRAKLGRALGAEDMVLVALRQIHSDAAHVFSAPPDQPQQGDAAISRQPGLLLTVQTADCVPILLADRRRRVVAAVHAGWRGTLARVAAKTLGRMRLEFDTRPEDVIAALGPAIGRCCYEVGPEVAQAFASQFASASDWFDGPFERLALGEEPNPLPWLTMMPPGHQLPPERVWLDLRAANRRQLEDAGVAPRNIAVSALCTACRTDLLFSYRREGSGTGRLMAAIGIRARAH